ncbi:MAG: thioredoxin family protein [Planctomycetia bacterium]|nr:thioredoxin family protein [Planctomycetia bacterium]
MSAMPCCRSWLAAVVLVMATGTACGQKLDILTGKPLGSPSGGQRADTPESVISVRAHVTAATANRPAALSVTAKIAPPWYTYSTTQKPVLSTPTEITVDSSPDYQIVGEFRPNLPPTILRKEGVVFETYAPNVTWQAPLEIRPGTDLKNLRIAGAARLQVCKDGSCLNPTNFAFTALLAEAEGGASADAKATGVYTHPNIHATIRGQLEPQTVTPGSTVNLVLTAEPAAGWHIYELANRDTGDLGYKPTLIVLTNTSGFQSQPTEVNAKPTESKSEIPGEGPLRYHAHPVTWSTAITIPKDTKPGQYAIAGMIGYQTCQDVQCDLPRAATFEGVFTVGAAESKGPALLALGDAKYGEAARLAAMRTPNAERALAPSPPNPDMASLPMIMLASLIGGFILNFMPCVLPVIGLKILSFAEQAGRSRTQVLALNLWYSLGLILVFLVLATLASAASLGLREENLGWGEQFTSTSFNVVMVAVVFVMALSFLDVWEIPIPGFVGSGVAADAAAREGAAGAFAKGVLTTVLATPCSGPLLGSVFAFTLRQPPPITYLIFSCVGLGMASPYLLIGAFPRLIRFLPKPGAWMDTFKQMMGFVMLGTIVYLFTFINRDYLVPTFAMMVGLWAGCWWIGRTSLVETLGRKTKAWSQGVIFAGLVGWFAFTWLVPHSSIIAWQNFSQQELAKARTEGKTVLVDFTADWCWTCKMNLRLAIETNEVKDLIAQNQVVPLLADWTDGSPEIKKMLESLNSVSIPFLAIFPADGRAPLVLRDLISKQDLLEKLKDAGPSKNAPKSLTAAMP